MLLPAGRPTATAQVIAGLGLAATGLAQVRGVRAGHQKKRTSAPKVLQCFKISGVFFFLCVGCFKAFLEMAGHFGYDKTEIV